jgi:hypothetical protein
MSVAVAGRVKAEVRKIVVTAVFFSIGFCIIILHNRLLTEGSTIQIASYGRAVVGGLIVAKMLLSVDMLPFVHAFPHKPLVHNIVWKSLLYVVASLCFLYMEPFLKHLVRGFSLSVSHSRAWHELMLPRTWATVIWLAVLLVVFVTAQEVSRVIGKEQLKSMFFGNKRLSATEVRFPDAA